MHLLRLDWWFKQRKREEPSVREQTPIEREIDQVKESRGIALAEFHEATRRAMSASLDYMESTNDAYTAVKGMLQKMDRQNARTH